MNFHTFKPVTKESIPGRLAAMFFGVPKNNLIQFGNISITELETPKNIGAMGTANFVALAHMVVEI